MARTLHLTWTYSGNGSDGNGTDVVYVTIYNESKRVWASYPVAGKREDLTVACVLPTAWSVHDRMHVYVAYMKVGGLETSDTQYLLIAH